MNKNDDKFWETVYDKDGKEIRVIKERIDAQPLDSSKFTYYDSSHGHCALCGRIICHGQCFK